MKCHCGDKTVVRLSLISSMGVPLLVSWHLYIKSGPWLHMIISDIKPLDILWKLIDYYEGVYLGALIAWSSTIWWWIQHCSDCGRNNRGHTLNSQEITHISPSWERYRVSIESDLKKIDSYDSTTLYVSINVPADGMTQCVPFITTLHTLLHKCTYLIVEFSVH